MAGPQQLGTTPDTRDATRLRAYLERQRQAGQRPDPRVDRRVDPAWWGFKEGASKATNGKALRTAIEMVGQLNADVSANPMAGTGGYVEIGAGSFDVDDWIVSNSDAVQIKGAGIATRINFYGAGGLRFGTLAAGGKADADTHNVKNVVLSDLYLVAAAGHDAGPIVSVPASHRFVGERLNVVSSENTNLITGLYFSAFQYVSLSRVLARCNAYPLHFHCTAGDPHYEAHVEVHGSELVQNGNVQAGECASLHVEMENGADDPIRDFLVSRSLLSAFTKDPTEANTIGLKITNPNSSPALLSALFEAGQFEQDEVLVDASTYAPNDTSHIAFKSMAFLGKNGVTLAGFKGNDFASRPYFESCTFTNMLDMIVQDDPTLGPHNYVSGVTGSMLPNPGNVRYNGLERPLMNQARFRYGGSVSAANNDDIDHNLIAAPSRVVVTTQDSNVNASVGQIHDTYFKLALRDMDGNLVNTPTTVYWEAAL